MPIYPYRCDACGHCVEVVRSIKDPSTAPACSVCAATMGYVFTRTTVIGAAVQHAEFNPGLGCVTRSKQHRAAIVKERGLIELGNENRESVGKTIKQDHERKRAQEWDAL